MDKETTKIMTEGEHLSNLIKSEGWTIVKRKLVERISELGDIMQFGADDIRDPQKLMLNLAANQQAVKVLTDWLRDIDGDVQKYRVHFGVINSEDNEHIKTYE